MAELQTNSRSARKVLRVDFTPLVDLAFLLVTFFVFTSNMSTPTAMQAFWPKEGDSTKIAQSGAITVLADGDRMFYYAGKNMEQEGQALASLPELRAMLAQAKTIRHLSDNPKDKLMVIIKPTDNCRFQKVVDLLDEMTIGQIGSYAIAEPVAGEMQWIASNSMQQ